MPKSTLYMISFPHSASWYCTYKNQASSQDLLTKINNSFDKARQIRKYGVTARQEALSHYNNALDALDKLSSIEHLSSNLVEIMLQIHSNKGRILLVEKNLDEAKDNFQSVLDLIRRYSLYNETAELYFDISMSYLNSLAYENAVSILKKALQTNPQNLIVSQLDQHETAIDKLRKVVDATVEIRGQIHEDTAAIYLAFGDMMLIQQQYDEAKLSFKNALNTITALFGPDPQQLFYYYNAIGQLYSKISDQEVEAQVYSKETAKLNDKFRYDEVGLAEDYVMAGDVYSSRKEYEKALMSYHKALRILDKCTDKEKERLVRKSILKCSELSGNTEIII